MRAIARILRSTTASKIRESALQAAVHLRKHAICSCRIRPSAPLDTACARVALNQSTPQPGKIEDRSRPGWR